MKHQSKNLYLEFYKPVGTVRLLSIDLKNASHFSHSRKFCDAQKNPDVRIFFFYFLPAIHGRNIQPECLIELLVTFLLALRLKAREGWNEFCIKSHFYSYYRCFVVVISVNACAMEMPLSTI